MAKKTDKTNKPSAGEIILYQSPDGKAALDVRLEGESLWLNLNQIAGLFERDKSVISRHLGNVFRSGELDRNSVVAFFATTAADGKTYNVEYFNLDAIISVGYRVNSKRGTQFRIWATNVLREHLVRGFTLNEKRLREQEQKLTDLRRTVGLLEQTLAHQAIGLDEVSDGNKRIAAALFIAFLAGNTALYRNDGSKRIADNALVAITLMIAESNPTDKETMVKLIVNLINARN